jgi:hypothetical protein
MTTLSTSQVVVWAGAPPLYIHAIYNVLPMKAERSTFPEETNAL